MGSAKKDARRATTVLNADHGLSFHQMVGKYENLRIWTGGHRPSFNLVMNASEPWCRSKQITKGRHFAARTGKSVTTDLRVTIKFDRVAVEGLMLPTN
jgi:hypothetical protein